MAAKPFNVSGNAALKGRDLIEEVDRTFPVSAREAREIRSAVAAILDHSPAARGGRKPPRKTARSRRAPRAARRSHAA
jgi:hypothetical protein